MSTPSAFDARAATWDENPRRRALAQAIVTGIVAAVPLHPSMHVLDVGCGTGLVGLPLATSVASVSGVDLSRGMVEQFNVKAVAAGLGKVRAEVRNLMSEPLPAGSMDLAVSAMAFHHIPDAAGMLTSIVATLAPGGWLAIADLEQEDGSFHDEPVPHFGFEPMAFSDLIMDAGIFGVRSQRVHVMERPDRPRSYPVFLAVGRKG